MKCFAAIFIPEDRNLVDGIIENKELLLFLLCRLSDKPTEVLVCSLLCHSKWQEYRRDTRVQIIVSKYLECFSDDEQRHCKEIVLEAVKSDKQALQYVSDELKNDEEIIIAAVRSHGTSLQYVSHKWRASKEIVQMAVESDGCAIEYVSDEWKTDRKIVLTAIRTNGRALRYLSNEMRNFDYAIEIP